MSLQQRLPFLAAFTSPSASWSEKLPSLLMLGALLGVSLYSLAQLSGAVYQDWFTEPAEGDRPQTQLNRLQSQKSVTAAELANAHFFGTADTANAGAAPITDDVQETQLRLELRGIIHNSEASLSKALIAEQGQTAHYYSPEDSLPNGADIYSIEQDRVVLSRNGQLESLSFANKHDSSSRSSYSPTRSTTTGDIEEAGTLSIDQRMNSIKERLKKLRQEQQ